MQLTPLQLSTLLSFALGVSAIPTQTRLLTASGLDADRQTEKYDLTPAGTYAFSGITTFHQLPSTNCLTDSGISDDILVVGLPFDTATSYRSGTRFGPNAIRQGSRAASLA